MITRYGAPVAGTEKEILLGMIDHYRQLIRQICEGVDEEDLRRPLTASGTTLLGMIKHLAYVERWWFQHHITGEAFDYPFSEDDPDGDFRIETDETSKEILGFHERECARSNEVLSRVSLDDIAKANDRRHDYSVRWIMVHMLEELARHTGHADILREMIDGETGRGYDP